jgi:hypothetical protein
LIKNLWEGLTIVGALICYAALGTLGLMFACRLFPPLLLVSLVVEGIWGILLTVAYNNPFEAFSVLAVPVLWIAREEHRKDRSRKDDLK